MKDSPELSIVLVDDEEMILEIYSSLFRRWYRVKAFNSAENLLRSLDEIRPNLFLIDWKMPEIDGISLCRRLREIKRFDLVPIAFFTVLEPTLSHLQEAYSAGSQSFICKSHSPPFIVAQVRVLIESYARIAHYLHNQKLLLSTFKHDLANLLSGITTGVEVLTMQPAFRDPELKSQSRLILKAADEIRNLFHDLNAVLAPYGPEKKENWREEDLQQIAADLREYTSGLGREINYHLPPSLKIHCGRRTLGRCLYYLVTLIDRLAPLQAPLAVKAASSKMGITFTVSGKGCFKDRLADAFRDLAETELDEERHDVMRVEYIRAILAYYHASLLIIEEGRETGFRFILPSSPPV